VKYVFVDGRWFQIHEEAAPPEKPGDKKSSDDGDTNSRRNSGIEGAGR
jgi:hypothetical protein